MEFQRLFVALLILGCVSAHNFIMDPAQRGGAGSASQTNPCGGAYAGPTFDVIAGDSFSVTWSTNHADANRMYLKMAEYTAGDTAFLPDPANAAGPFVYTADYASSNGGTSDTRTVTVPESAIGVYTLQWSWAGWYNCIDFNVFAAPPAGATLATLDPSTNTMLVGNTVLYLTADGYGLFDVSTGELTCIEGYQPYNDENGNLAGCEPSSGTSPQAIQVQLTLLVDGSTVPSTFQDDAVAALADALGVDESALLLVNYDDSNSTVVLTINIQPGEDGSSAALTYNLLLEQYSTTGSSLLTDPIFGNLDTTVNLVATTVSPGSGSSAGGTIESDSDGANTIAAGVMVPLAIGGIAGVLFIGRGTVRTQVASAASRTAPSRVTFTSAVFTFVLWLFILIATGAQSWSVAGGNTRVGPFELCVGNSCFDTLKYSAIPDSAHGLLNACRTFMMFSVFLCLALLAGLILLAIDKLPSAKSRLQQFGFFGMLCLLLFQFISACMWGAFHNDYLGGGFSYGFSYGLCHINWVICVFLSVAAYSLTLSADDTKASSGNVQDFSATTDAKPQV